MNGENRPDDAMPGEKSPAFQSYPKDILSDANCELMSNEILGAREAMRQAMRRVETAAINPQAAE